MVKQMKALDSIESWLDQGIAGDDSKGLSARLADAGRSMQVKTITQREAEKSNVH